MPFSPLRLFFCTLFFFFCNYQLNAQLCSGSLGDPVVNITFGSGNNPGNPLTSGITNYTYINADCPQDGEYTIRNQTLSCNVSTWHTLNHDHTGDPNGYFMLVNANIYPSDFYLQTVKGLCSNTTYEFAAWILNICNLPISIRPNITFSIENPADGSKLKTFNTLDIPVTSSPEWKQYGFYFTTPSGISSVILRMTNNAPGGNGNDLALDDITFRPCGPMINAAINGNANNETESCEGNTTILNFNASVSQGYLSPFYQWQVSIDSGITWSDITGATSTNYQRLPTSKGIFQYRLAVAESGNMGISSCRVVSNAITVRVHPKPNINLATISPVCSGTELSLKATITNYSNPVWSSAWSYPDANVNIIHADSAFSSNSIILSKSIKASSASTGKYYLFIQDAYGCTGIDSTNVVIWNKPTAGFSIPAVTCENKKTDLINSSTGPVQLIGWNWNFGDGDSSKIKDPSHFYNLGGTYPASLSVTDVNGCISDTLIQNILIHSLPGTNFELPRICLADPFAIFIDSTFINDHSESQFSYLWNFGEPVSGSNNISTNKNPRHSYSAVGTYNVQLTVTSKDGCSKDTLKIFTVNGSIPKAGFTINNPGVLCSNDSLKIINNSGVDFGSIVKVEIWWDYNNNPLLLTSDNVPFTGKAYTQDYTGLMDSAIKTFKIHYVAYSGISCLNEIDKTISINRSPVVEFSPVKPVCVEVPPFIITTALENTGASGKGKFTGQGMENDSLFNPRKAGPGTHTINYDFTTDAGCSANQDQSIIIYDQPKVEAGADKTIVKGSFVYLHATVSGNNLSYSWTPSGSLDNNLILSPKAFPESDIIYTLKIKSAEGCTNQDDVFVKVLTGLYIPSAFTPNGDGLNDVWRLPILDSYPDAEAWIFNRWGQSIFHSKGSLISWDGKFNGILQSAGTYIYLIDLKSGGPKIKGTITLIR